MAVQIIFYLATLVPLSYTGYIEPGPAYPCPKDSQSALLYPCVCENGTDAGLYVRCKNAGLAVLSVGIGNIAGLGLPIEKLVLEECQISHLFGPLFHRSTIRVLHIKDSPIRTIDSNAFAGVNRTLQELQIINSQIEEFPKEAFKILGNLTTLVVDGHRISSLGKDIFSGSAAAGPLERLRVTNGRVSELAPDALQHLKKLKVLDLHGNRFVTLKKSQFKGLRDAEVLDLSYNNLTKVDGSHLGDLTKLGWCNVSHNMINDIPRGMFARNTVLKVVHLDNNKLKKLDTNSLKGMRFLRRLYLQDNEISSIGRGTFSSVTRIGTVDLARNKITKVDFQMFHQVKYAEIINLAENQITHIESQAFTDLYLAVVNISHNALTTIEAGSFQNCQNLTALDLSHNLLENITKYAFDENTYASDLDVTFNRFTDFAQIPISNMTGIRLINASHNQITRIPKNSFPKLFELHTVDVSHNNITEIFNAVFQSLFSLRYINLSYNSLKQIKPSTFGTLPTVLELDLSHNQLVDVSKGSLAKLASCRVIDVSHNQLTKIFQIPISLSLQQLLRSSLDLSHNNISEVPAGVWPAMNALLRLNLSSNQLSKDLEGGSFRGLVAASALDLSSNGVSKPPREALAAMPSLQYLYLQDNNITSLSKAAFGVLPTLFHLDLSNNQIRSIAKLSFTGLQQTLYLSLRGNALTEIPTDVFRGLVALRTLDLSQNNLEKLDNKTNGVLDDLLSLETLNISYNQFSQISKKTFPSSPWIPYRLATVDLSHNLLYVLTPDINHGTRKLRSFNMSDNYINEIRNSVLGNFTSLQVLDLSNNQLKNLVSKISEEKFNLPTNITRLYLQNNKLQELPIADLERAEHLRELRVENNELTSFYPGLVTGIEVKGLEVDFEGNHLKCDCHIRPLIHYINSLPPSSLPHNVKYTNLTCAEPVLLQNENIMAVDEERYLCHGNDSEVDSDTDGQFRFTNKPDLAFRDIQYAQTSIYVHWFVNSNRDIADFYIYMRSPKNQLIYSNDVAYTLRSITIAIDKKLETSLKTESDIDICVQAKTSTGSARKWYKSQCQKVMPDFESWPKKLSVDKRRLTKKKVKYTWFSNSVLGLVSDSILITLCIFLGVCFRRLNDFEL